VVVLYIGGRNMVKTLFKTFTELKNTPFGGMNHGQLPDMSKMMGDLMNISKNMGKFK
jgi:hypothetical protein